MHQAEDAQQDIDKYTLPTSQGTSSFSELSAETKARPSHLKDARDDLARARRLYVELMETPLPDGVKAVAKDVAARIEEASLDRLTESGWDGFVPKGKDAADVALWWASLSAMQRAKLVKHDPARIGNLNGVPCATRDKANRIVLANKLAALKKQMSKGFPDGEPDEYITSFRGYPPVEYREKNDRWNAWNALRKKLATSSAIQSAIGSSAESGTLLLGYQPDEGQGRAITSYGDPDTATNVSTLVGGVSTNLSNLLTYMQDSQRMQQQAQLLGAKRAAAVTWWGYDAPPGLTDAMDKSRADAGAPALDAFQSALRVTHEGAPSLNTVVGHSYGSTLVGDAAAHGRTLDADNVIFLGSPGVTVDHAGDLHLTGVAPGDVGAHVFDTRAQNDIIQVVQPVKKYGWTLAGVPVLGPWALQKDVTAQRDLAGDPWDKGFGDQRFLSDPGKAMKDPLHGIPMSGFLFPKTLPTVDAHGSYWFLHNKALLNMGSIIAGKGVAYAP